MKNILGAWHPDHIEVIIILIFSAAIVAEIVADKRLRLSLYEARSARFNLFTGCLSFGAEILVSLATVPLMLWIQQRFSIFSLNHGYWYEWCLLFVVLDFMEYWFHRWSHEVNLLWLAHVVHHQDTGFNLSVGLRTSFFVYFFNILFYALLPLLGFGVLETVFMLFIQGMYQLFIHTKLVKKLGVLERILVTPSAHRVHHGSNDIYVDKNYGKVFIFWDIVFGTYESETEEVVYGVKDKARFASPLSAVFHPWILFLKQWHFLKGKRLRWKLLFAKPDRVKEIVSPQNVLMETALDEIH